ncbi:MAG TPA: hypothetical protein VJT31_16265 [Rugosimonospora sp.]|nr:hypothetical protein [Rugosimonospora sp.]
MERVAFIVDATGERVDCLLNPQTVEVGRAGGVRAGTGTVGGYPAADQPLLLTGGGRTELVLDLLFDVDLVESGTPPEDVRALTGRLWQLAENSVQERGGNRPPLVRFVWGKAWNVPGIIAAIAERFDAFGPTGCPRRSWLRLKLWRVAEPAPAAPSYEGELTSTAGSAPAVDAVPATGDGQAGPGYSGVRFDLLAQSALGDPREWRRLAEHNDIADPMEVPPGTVLSVPPAGGAP